MASRSVLTLGNFDGPHRGHREILARARRLADEQASGGTRVVAITFDPPPIEILRPGSEPPRIATLEQRRRGLIDAGADEVEIITPTPEMLGQSPASFVDQLVRRHSPTAILEGPDFRFGKGRAGDMATLAALGKQHGFDAITVPRLHATLANLHTVPVSSSLIRWLVGRGRVADAAACLGRWFTLTASVARGEQRGRTLDVPTANLDTAEVQPFIIPADGVYAGWAEPDDSAGGKLRPAAISVGVKPTFGHRQLTVEAHLLGFTGDLYGRTLTLHFARWLRDQYPFPGVGALRAQLQRDIERTGRLTADAGPRSSFPAHNPA